MIAILGLLSVLASFILIIGSFVYLALGYVKKKIIIKRFITLLCSGLGFLVLVLVLTVLDSEPVNNEPVQVMAEQEGWDLSEEEINSSDELRDDDEGNSNSLTFGSKFEFWGFEIEIGDEEDIIWKEIENSFSDYYGESVLGIPVKLTNLGVESGRLNSFGYTFFGPDGTQTRNMEVNFSDYDIWSQGDMRPEASQEGYFMLLYAGDGEYVIEFARPAGSFIEVSLDITK